MDVLVQLQQVQVQIVWFDHDMHAVDAMREVTLNDRETRNKIMKRSVHEERGYYSGQKKNDCIFRHVCMQTYVSVIVWVD